MRFGMISPRKLMRTLTPSRPYSGLPARILFQHTPALVTAPFRARYLPPKVYGNIGELEVRLARTKWDVRRAQRARAIACLLEPTPTCTPLPVRQLAPQR